MNAPLPGEITRQLRDFASTAAETRVVDTNALLDLANAVEYLEGNFLYLANITAASADDIAELKGVARFRLDRHYSILEKVAQMLSGIPTWRYPDKPAHVRDRVMRGIETLSTRLKKVPR